MTNVYMNAICTFSICWETPEGGGFRSRNTRTIPRYSYKYVASATESGDHAFVLDAHEWHLAIDQAQVNLRGWVFQERLLSRKILYLGNDELYWECDELQARETNPLGIPFGTKVLVRTNIIDRNLFFADPFWRDLVKRFMRLDLTFERDRLIAISGIARFLFNRIGDEYIAGIPKKYWIEGLLWSPSLGYTASGEVPYVAGPELYTRRPEETLPSWSWAACPGPIEWPLPVYDYKIDGIPELPHISQKSNRLAYLKDSSLVPLGGDIYGLPRSATLDFACLLIPARFTECDSKDEALKAIEETKDEAGPNPEHGYLVSDGFVLPLPYPRVHRNGLATITIPFKNCAEFSPTCFIVPLVDFKTTKGTRAMGGLIIQERLSQTNDQDTTDCGIREFVRIGSFSTRKQFDDEVDLIKYGIYNAIAEQVPTCDVDWGQVDEGAVFLSKLGKYVQERREGVRVYDGTREDLAVKAEWTTIRLV
ncbi:hypothetical protein ACHAPJ_005213 [Fusarium lateritium]